MVEDFVSRSAAAKTTRSRNPTSPTLSEACGVSGVGSKGGFRARGSNGGPCVRLGDGADTFAHAPAVCDRRECFPCRCRRARNNTKQAVASFSARAHEVMRSTRHVRFERRMCMGSKRRCLRTPLLAQYHGGAHAWHGRVPAGLDVHDSHPDVVFDGSNERVRVHVRDTRLTPEGVKRFRARFEVTPNAPRSLRCSHRSGSSGPSADLVADNSISNAGRSPPHPSTPR
jgi:hypothetical protein